MRYTKGDCAITVEMIDGFGKNPGLWIGAGNELVKVASFGNADKAQQFCKWFEYFVGLTDKVPKWGEDDGQQQPEH